MAEVIDGKSVAEDVVSKVKALTAELSAKGATKPGLAVVIVGEDPASQVYVASKSRTAKECGFHSLQQRRYGIGIAAHFLRKIPLCQAFAIALY